jgi:hypothetical protein
MLRKTKSLNISQRNKSRSQRSKSHRSRKHSLQSLSKYDSFYSPLKSTSITKSDQGDEGTCMAHTCAHLVVKNVFEKLYPLKLSKKDQSIYEENSCNQYLKTHSLMDISLISNCSVHGYYKILLFLYVYFSAYDNFVSKGKKHFLSPIINFVLKLEYIPPIFSQTMHLPILLNLLTQIKKRITTLNIKFDTVDIYDTNEVIVRKILDGGFYVAMQLTNLNTMGHVATIVDHTPNQFLVKNTWKEKIDYIRYKDLDSFPLMYDNSRWTLNNYFTILPIFDDIYEKELYSNPAEREFIINYEIYPHELPIYKKWLFGYISNMSKSKTGSKAKKALVSLLSKH